jgi:hypothetical protein
MTAFSMRALRSWPSRPRLSVALLVMHGLLVVQAVPPAAWATEPSGAPPGASLSVADVRAQIDEESSAIVLSGQVSVSLSPVLVQAIERGVTLSFLSEFSLVRPRWWWWDDEQLRVTRQASLTFHPVSRQFRVSVDGAKPQAFSDLTEALKACLAVRGWRVLQPHQWPEGLEGRLRLQLDPSALPKALQVTAIASEDWVLSSGRVKVARP